MIARCFTVEQIIAILKEAEVGATGKDCIAATEFPSRRRIPGKPGSAACRFPVRVSSSRLSRGMRV